MCYGEEMSSPFSEARKRQLARLGGAKPPTARAAIAIAIAKSQAYQDAADAPSTLRAYTEDLANYEAALDGEFAAATPQLMERGPEFRDRLQAALNFTKPQFNEAMRSGQANM